MSNDYNLIVTLQTILKKYERNGGEILPMIILKEDDRGDETNW